MLKQNINSGCGKLYKNLFINCVYFCRK